MVIDSGRILAASVSGCYDGISCLKYDSQSKLLFAAEIAGRPHFGATTERVSETGVDCALVPRPGTQHRAPSQAS